MRKIILAVCFHLSAISLFAQTLNVQVGNVTYQFPASQAGVMSYNDGTTLTAMGKAFALSEVDKMWVDETVVTDNMVSIVYSSSSAQVTVAGNVAQYVTPTLSGAHVSIAQTNTAAVNNDEITYQLSGTTANGSFALSGSYKATVALAGLTLTNPNGAAINISNSKRIQLSAKQGTTNTLADCASGSQKACVYSKGQLQLQGNGTLNITGNTKHGIKSASYISVKNLTLNITSTVGDGINCEEYMEIKSGTITLTGIGDDGIQCDLGGTSSTGITTGHEDEDTGNIYISGGTINVNCEYKGIKAQGDLDISDGTVSVTSNASASSNGNHWGGSSSTSSPEAIEAKGAIAISGGQIYAHSADDAINAGGNLTISGGLVYAHSTSNDGLDANGNCYIKGGLVYAIGASSPEVAIDANTEGGYKLYVQGGTIVAIGGLESGASLTQSCYSTGSSSSGGGGGRPGGGGSSSTSWSKNTWYALTVGSTTFAFKTPSSGGSTMVVSGAGTPTLQSGVTASGTAVFDGVGYYPATVSGGSSVTLSSYSGGNSGGGPGGWW
ncbi:MAG: carbohydrate-binding domain-containing protein [Paludibacteraceae bacterium]|nr:carbohydrate-binding domain-containing protein [Paludibacteraceae bacterium]